MFTLKNYLAKITLPPGGTFSFQERTTSLTLFQAHNPIQMKHYNQTFGLSEGSIILGSQLSCKNASNLLSNFHSFSFVMKSSNQSSNPIFQTGLEQNELALRIMNTEIHSEADTENIEKLFNLLYETAIITKGANPPGISATINKKIDVRLITINRFIRKNYSEPLSLGLLADLIGCHPVYLSNKYSKVFHISPMKYLQKIRMKKASELLLQTTFTISEIASKLGYISASQFGVLFKKYYGVPPYEYRVKYFVAKSTY